MDLRERASAASAAKVVLEQREIVDRQREAELRQARHCARQYAHCERGSLGGEIHVDASARPSAEIDRSVERSLGAEPLFDHLSERGTRQLADRARRRSAERHELAVHACDGHFVICKV
jgi:hypothetical protein